MQEARSLLARPDISVKEIITRVGYSGKSFFYKNLVNITMKRPCRCVQNYFDKQIST
ncbi:hypothetical protein SDC49_20640 [Lactobacillus sp. R2/2]|nr:hypothetical protein [Lactobacillus sp. R2/2]